MCRVLVLLVVLLVGGLVPAAPPVQSAGPDSSVQVTAASDRLFHLDWEAPAAVRTGSAPITETLHLPLVEIGGVRLPAHLVPVRPTASEPESLMIHIEDLEQTPWPGDGLATAATDLPTAPVFVLRAGRMRGQRIVVVAFSPFFAQHGATQLVTRVRATIAGATLLDPADPALRAHTSAPFLAQAPAPVNPHATVPAWKIQVTSGGIQRISRDTLAAAGLDLDRIDPTQLHLWHSGNPVALEIPASTGELRFYAPPPGDRWNAADTYWLTQEATPGPRIFVQRDPPGPAPPRTTARQTVHWSRSTRYDSWLPGPDADHWFAAAMLTGPQQTAVTLAITVTPTLPLASGPVSLTLTGSAHTVGPHRLAVQVGNTAQVARWDGAGTWAQTVVFTSTAPFRARPTGPITVHLRLQPGAATSHILLDQLVWDWPVQLDMGAQVATTFTGIPGTWTYQIANVSAERLLYDIRDPRAPVRIPLAAGLSASFADGPTARRYLLTDLATLAAPTISAHTPHDIAQSSGADVVYIAPAAFHAALAPLVALREAQAYRVAVVDVQAIYDAWSYGQVDPAAIRNFLRSTAATWNPAPAAVVLVGDGSEDPRNYSRRFTRNLVPPYLAWVDPWLGETACDTCYVQLDGEHPLDDSLPDMAIGRLPVKSASEVATLIAKITGYETALNGGAWRRRVVLVADNARDAAGTPDHAGDFAALSDTQALSIPESFVVDRVYYDPTYDPTEPDTAEPWREPEAARARQHTLDAFNAGAGLVVYTGHGHPWQWAVTDPHQEQPYLLGLYDPDSLTNDTRLPVVLAMTCLTSAFQQASYSGTTVDERLLLHANGGAIAVWGSTGLGVVHGHEWLQRGFQQALWANPTTAPVLGTLTQAGYVRLFTQGTCCQDALRTFVLLGDPLTRPHLWAERRVYLPLIHIANPSDG